MLVEIQNFIKEYEKVADLDVIGSKEESAKTEWGKLKRHIQTSANLKELADIMFLIRVFKRFFEGHTKKLNKIYDTVENVCSEVMDDQEVQKFAADGGTVSRSMSAFAKVDKEHFNELVKWIGENEHPELLKTSINPKPLEELLKENVIPPHVELTTKPSLRLTAKRS